jgi:hypothetical protein
MTSPQLCLLAAPSETVLADDARGRNAYTPGLVPADEPGSPSWASR